MNPSGCCSPELQIWVPLGEPNFYRGGEREPLKAPQGWTWSVGTSVREIKEVIRAYQLLLQPPCFSARDLQQPPAAAAARHPSHIPLQYSCWLFHWGSLMMPAQTPERRDVTAFYTLTHAPREQLWRAR